MNFATLPPEINSGRMYAGPGSGSITEAVAAWARLATRLHTAVAEYRAVTSQLAITRAAAPYINWLNATAAHVEHVATQAMVAASAHEAALAAMVPPPVIEANRAQRRALAKANCLGHASPAIADTEAAYEQMWARDVEAMHAYADASADASTMTPFTSPPSATAATQVSRTWVVTSAPELISAGHQVTSTIPEALQELSVSPLTTIDEPLSTVSPSLSKLASLSASSDTAINHLNFLNRNASLDKATALRSLITKPGGPGWTTVTARFGRGISIGALSVPPAWAKAIPSPDTAEVQCGWVYESPMRPLPR